MDTCHNTKESLTMVHIECPWCMSPAASVLAEALSPRDAIDCADCGVRVELAPDPAVADLAPAA